MGQIDTFHTDTKSAISINLAFIYYYGVRTFPMTRHKHSKAHFVPISLLDLMIYRGSLTKKGKLRTGFELQALSQSRLIWQKRGLNVTLARVGLDWVCKRSWSRIWEVLNFRTLPSTLLTFLLRPGPLEKPVPKTRCMLEKGACKGKGMPPFRQVPLPGFLK